MGDALNSPTTTIRSLMPKPSRLRRVFLVLTLAALIIVLAAWPMSYWRGACLGYAVNFSMEANESKGVLSKEILDGRSWEVWNDVGMFMTRWSVLPIVNVKPTGQDWTRVTHQWNAEWTAPKMSGAHLNQRWPITMPMIRPIYFVSSNVMSKGQLIGRSISIPHWLPALALSIVAFCLWFPPHRLAKRLARNQCLRCGYDRQGLAPDSPCPECAQKPTTPRAA